MATTKVTANVLADNSITQAKLADDAIGAAELAANAVVNASIASGAAIDMDKLDGDSLASAITDFAQDDLVILSDTSDSGNLKSMTASNLEDAIFGNISGDVTLAAGGAATAAAAQTNITSVLNTSLILGRDGDNQIKFGTDNQIIFEVSGGDNVIFKASGEIEATSLDISGDVDVDGTLEADAITVNGATLAETISDTVGAMVGSNTETGIAVSYDDSDNTLDFVIGAGVIVNSMLADDAVGADELAANAVVTASIADDQVTQAKMANDAVGADELAANAVVEASMVDDAVTAAKLASNAVVTASIVDDNITHAKLEPRYTTLVAKGTGTDQTLDFATATTFTATMNGNATFTITNPKQGQVVDLIVAGNHTLTLAMSGATFNKIGTVNYDGSTTNLIQIVVADDASSEIFYYSVAPIASDTTP
jgi:hypothetical protein